MALHAYPERGIQNISMSVRQMVSDDISVLVDIHVSSWNPDEISVRLGSEFIRIFYTDVVESPYSFTYVYEYDGEICGYATGFRDYQAFNSTTSRKNRTRLALVMLKRVLARKVGLADILNLLSDGKKFRNAKYPKHHVGALALANQYKGTPIGKEAIGEAIGAVLTEFEGSGYPGCAAVCQAVNMPMRKYFLKLGFEEVDMIDMVGKSVVLFEMTFDGQ